MVCTVLRDKEYINFSFPIQNLEQYGIQNISLETFMS